MREPDWGEAGEASGLVRPCVPVAEAAWPPRGSVPGTAMRPDTAVLCLEPLKVRKRVVWRTGLVTERRLGRRRWDGRRLRAHVGVRQALMSCPLSRCQSFLCLFSLSCQSGFRQVTPEKPRMINARGFDGLP